MWVIKSRFTKTDWWLNHNEASHWCLVTNGTTTDTCINFWGRSRHDRTKLDRCDKSSMECKNNSGVILIQLILENGLTKTMTIRQVVQLLTVLHMRLRLHGNHQRMDGSNVTMTLLIVKATKTRVWDGLFETLLELFFNVHSVAESECTTLLWALQATWASGYGIPYGGIWRWQPFNQWSPQPEIDKSTFTTLYSCN